MSDDRLLESLRFLEILFADKQETDYVVIWCKYPTFNKTFCFRDLDQAASCGQAEGAKGADVYLGVGPLYLDLTGQPRRGTKGEIAAISGVWLDLDVISPGHKKADLFPSNQAARDFLIEIDLAPTLVIESGGGLQCYFLFERMVRFVTDEDRFFMDRLSQGFQQKVRREALARVNCEIDMTGDITRVLRLPGTINQKYAIKPPVRQIEYNPAAILAIEPLKRFVSLAPLDLLRKPVLKETPTPARVNLAIDLPESCKLLMDLEPRFKAACYREGGTLSGKDSDSEYDLSIASQAVNAHVSDADIAACIAWSRRNFAGSDEARKQKWRRADYIERTIRRAHTTGAIPGAIEIFAEKDEQLLERARPEPSPLDREFLLKQLSRTLGIEVIGVWQFGGDPPLLTLDTPKGRITLGTPTNLMSWPRINAQVWAQEHHNLKRLKADEWLGVMDMVGLVVEEIEIGDLADEVLWIAGKIREYIWGGRAIEYAADPSVWATQATPKHLQFEDSTWIRVEDFSSWIFHSNPTEVLPTRQTWGRMLRALDMATRQLEMKIEGKTTPVRQWFWSVPKKLMEE